MGDAESKHDKFLKRIHLWVAILGGVVTLAIGIYNFKNIFFPEKASNPPAVEAQTQSVPRTAANFSAKAASGDALTYEMFRSMDQNGDGRILESEWRGSREDFYLLNLDGNGALTPQDFQSARFEDMDRNADGQIARLEWRKARSSFDLLDSNRDGKISADEFDARLKAGGA